MYNKLKQEREERPSYQNDELDLRYVFDKIGNGFNYLFRKIRYVIQVVINRIFLLLLFILLGVGVGYFFFYTTKPYYTSSMTLMLANIRNEFIENQLDNLTIMIAEDNVEAVANRLDITPASARQIKDMKFSNLDADRVEEDSILTGSPFKIELSLYDREMFDTMEPAITTFLEGNRYFAKQKRIKQRQIESLISRLGVDLTSIDSMKTSVGAPRGPVNGFVYGQPVDPTNLYREGINMYKEQVQLEASLESLDNVEVVTGFAPKLRPTGPSLRKYLGIGALIAFIIGTILALNLESRKRRKNI